MGKLYDLAVVTRKYTDNGGNEKAVWKNIGSILETKNGGKIILIDRTFNPAGVPCEEGRDQIMISMFTPKERDATQREEHIADKANAYQKQQIGMGEQELEEDIQF